MLPVTQPSFQTSHRESVEEIQLKAPARVCNNKWSNLIFYETVPPCEQISNVMVKPQNRQTTRVIDRRCYIAPAEDSIGGCVMVGQVDRDRYARSILVTRRTNVFYKHWRTFALKGQVELFRRGVPGSVWRAANQTFFPENLFQRSYFTRARFCRQGSFQSCYEK